MESYIPSSEVSKLTPAVQQHTGEFLRKAIEHRKQENIMDSAILHEDNAPDVVKGLIRNLPEQVTFAGHRKYQSDKLIMDAIAEAAKQYKEEHGKNAPDWVFDSAIRTALPIASAEYAQSLGLDAEFTTRVRSAVMDDVGSTSGGAMRISQILVAITSAFTENIPFAGSIAMGAGLEGRVILVNHQAGNSVGDYKQGDKLDGINAGKAFLQAKRLVLAEKQSNNTDYTATVKHANTDSSGCPIRPDGVSVHVNGLIVVSSNPSSKRGSAVSGANSFHMGDKNYSVTLSSEDATQGKLKATFSEALPEGTQVHFSADVDYEATTMLNANKRPLVEVVADFKSIKAHYMSGRYKLTQEARQQWIADVGLDPNAQGSMILRNQSGAERHNFATQMMYLVGQSYQHNYDLKTSTRLEQRSYTSIMSDLVNVISEADTQMVLRTQLSSIGVIYVGAKAVPFFDSMPPEVFTPSGIQRRAGVYRLGTLLGKYEVYYSPIPELNNVEKNKTGFQLLCIGTSSQSAGNPYIIGDVLGAQLLPMNVNDDGQSGSYYFQALGDSVNPFSELASAAALINITI